MRTDEVNSRHTALVELMNHVAHRLIAQADRLSNHAGNSLVRTLQNNLTPVEHKGV